MAKYDIHSSNHIDEDQQFHSQMMNETVCAVNKRYMRRKYCSQICFPLYNKGNNRFCPSLWQVFIPNGSYKFMYTWMHVMSSVLCISAVVSL